jgi:serine/threonine protein kinase
MGAGPGWTVLAGSATGARHVSAGAGSQDAVFYEEVLVKGTPRFMAPEIVRGEALPSTVSDLYSLAVFLFHIFMHGHPLEGSRTDSSYGWSEGHVSESDLAVDPDDPDVAGWNCRCVPPRPALLELPGRRVVLADGAVITSQHLSTDRDYRKVLAMVEPHPSRPGALVVRNLSGSAWTVVPDGEGQKTVNPDQRLGVRPMLIDFGRARGRVVVPSGGERA